MIGRLDIELLTTFVAVHETGGVTSAARQLNRTQPAISMQLRRLEERVGKTLFRRLPRALHLTAEGEALMPYAKRIVELSEEARQRMANPDLSGSARVGIPEWFATDALQGLMCRFARAHPSVRLDIEVNASHHLRDHLGSGKLDVALAICDFFETAPGSVWNEPLFWVAGDELRLTAEEPVPLALFQQPCPYRSLAQNRLTEVGRDWREVFTSSSVATVRAALISGLGVSVFPAGAVKPGLRILGSEEGFPELPPTRLAIYTAGGEVSEAAQYLSEYLSEHVSATLMPANKGLRVVQGGR